jgi:hypothetical protein
MAILLKRILKAKPREEDNLSFPGTGASGGIIQHWRRE